MKPSRLDNIFLKINRAKHHVEMLTLAIQDFLNSKPYSVAGQRNQRNGDFEWVLTSAKDFPIEICLIAGDVIHNLRSALDHLAWQLVLVNGNTPSRCTCFPISTSATEHLKQKAQNSMVGMRPEAIAAINAFKPYNGGNITLWRLHRLDILDKHKVLMPAAHAMAHHDVLPSQRAELTQTFLASHPGATPPDLRGMLIRPTDPLFPLEVGKVFFSIPESDMENDFRFKLDIAFNEPGLIQGEPVLQTVHTFLNTVEHIVSSFNPFLV